MEIDLKGKLALVTGGSGQLGRVICRTLGDCGADVVVHYYQNAAKANQLVKELEDKSVRAMSVQADVTDAAAIQAMKKLVETHLGTPDIIVNNAVIQYPWRSVLDQELVDFESQFRSCVLHNVIMAKVFLPGMIRKKWGRVIAINTECAMQNFPSQGAFVAGKRGLVGFLRVLAKEVGEHQITVNQVAPGWMISEDAPAGTGKGEKMYQLAVPLKRRGYDQDVANLVVFLSSDLANFITGQYISVSGGNVMPTI